MEDVISVELSRDCQAVQIPQGQTLTLPRGTPVDITQTLGGPFTVHTSAGLFRISRKDADALGLKAGSLGEAATVAPPETSDELTEAQVWDVLRGCYDPEIPVNIVDLGLIYDMQIERLPVGGALVDVKMTLTAPGCGMGAIIAEDAREKLLGLPGVAEAAVEVVWDPPWHPTLISPEGRRILGLEDG